MKTTDGKGVSALWFMDKVSANGGLSRNRR